MSESKTGAPYDVLVVWVPIKLADYSPPLYGFQIDTAMCCCGFLAVAQ